jgi:hypothetical protein
MGDRRIETLGDLVHYFPGAGVALRCNGCGRAGRYLARDLVAVHGGWCILRDLRFRCDGCGSGDVGVTLQRSAAEARPIS